MCRRSLLAVIVSAVLLAGCGGASEPQVSGQIEITENGVYDVSGYAEAVVNVVPEEPIPEPEPEPEPEEVPPETEGLELTRVQFDGFSMLVPVTMAPYYTEEAYRSYTSIHFFGPRIDGAESPTLDVSGDSFDYDVTVSEFSEDWMARIEVNGIEMSMFDNSFPEAGREDGPNVVEIIFVEINDLHIVTFMYPLGQEDVYQEYAEQFYYSIELD